MKNPFRKFGQALKIGYKVLQKYEDLEEAGLVPQLKVKGVPVRIVDRAARAFVEKIKDHHEAQDGK